MGQTFGYQEGDLPVTEKLSGCLLRLPLFYDITEAEQRHVIDSIADFFHVALPVARASVAERSDRVQSALEGSYAPKAPVSVER
jgi:hypothetical protein